jgi:crossover junction endodeoxyribonuclease RuvC
VRILGIDPGTATVGFGVIEYDGFKPTYITCGVISTSPDLAMHERLKIISEDLISILETHKPELVGVEDLFFCNNIKTAITVAQARGVMLLECAKYGLNPISFTPLQVKQAVSGFGGADKQQVGEMVMRLLELSAVPKPDDAADALAVAIATATRSGSALVK